MVYCNGSETPQRRVMLSVELEDQAAAPAGAGSEMSVRRWPSSELGRRSIRVEHSGEAASGESIVLMATGCRATLS